MRILIVSGTAGGLLMQPLFIPPQLFIFIKAASSWFLVFTELGYRQYISWSGLALLSADIECRREHH